MSIQEKFITVIVDYLRLIENMCDTWLDMQSCALILECVCSAGHCLSTLYL